MKGGIIGMKSQYLGVVENGGRKSFKIKYGSLYQIWNWDWEFCRAVCLWMGLLVLSNWKLLLDTRLSSNLNVYLTGVGFIYLYSNSIFSHVMAGQARTTKPWSACGVSYCLFLPLLPARSAVLQNKFTVWCVFKRTY